MKNSNEAFQSIDVKMFEDHNFTDMTEGEIIAIDHLRDNISSTQTKD